MERRYLCMKPFNHRASSMAVMRQIYCNAQLRVTKRPDCRFARHDAPIFAAVPAPGGTPPRCACLHCDTSQAR